MKSEIRAQSVAAPEMIEVLQRLLERLGRTWEMRWAESPRMYADDSSVKTRRAMCRIPMVMVGFD